MDSITNKNYISYDYISRYSAVPNYYHKLDDREFAGIGFNVLKNVPYAIHKVVDADTLDKIALKYYNNPTYWWIIAYFNDIQDAFIQLKDNYETLKVPQINSIVFGELR